MLEVQGLFKEFRGIKAIDDVSFTVPRGSITSLIGPNGAGKTTLINVVTGVLPPTRGTLLFGGQSLVGHRPNQVATLGIRRTFQTVRLFTGLSVRENLVIGRFRNLFAGGLKDIFLPMRFGDAAGRERADKVLRMFELEGLADEIATDLPYGTQRRVEIARALMGEPSFVLLDEPAAGMNEQETAQLVKDVRRIRDGGVTVFLVEHDMSMVMSVSDKVVVLNFGRKIAEGTPSEVQSNPEVITSYLGDE
ncbi:MAG: ABC transporter ATP-binding protein [Comamonadaceae bacterium]|nr:MAG: ABC transporter ATP-binding protein [Comamonadaceae bacterium]